MAVKKKFEQGNVVSLTHYVTIDKIESDGSLQVSDLDRNMKFKVKGDEILGSMKSASYYTKTEKISKTELAKKLTESFNVPFSVNFDKADGTTRTLVGRLIAPEPLLGRSKVFDFEDTKAVFKQVDHRSLHWMIVDGVNYEVK
jgi:hypothetical protein